MKVKLKGLTIKEDFINDIENGNIDTQKYINRVSEVLDNAHYLIKEKMLEMDDEELYKRFLKVFDIEFSDEDIRDILSMKYGKRYVSYRTFITDMVDENNNVIILSGLSTKKVDNKKSSVDIATLRKYVNSYDFLVLNTKRKPLTKRIKKLNKYEDYQFEYLNYSSDEKDNLSEYEAKLFKNKLKNKTLLKKVLRMLREHTIDIEYQAKFITKMQTDEEEMQKAVKKYKKAYEENFSRKKIRIKGNHKKSH